MLYAVKNSLRIVVQQPERAYHHRMLGMTGFNEIIRQVFTMNYFALTFNTFQFGTSRKLYFSHSVSVIEGYFRFDALLYFSTSMLCGRDTYLWYEF